jgi:hypothetical protein
VSVVKVVARRAGEDAALAEDLRAKGLRAKLVRGAVVVDLPKSDGDRGYYDIPPGLGGSTFLIDVAEEGGAFTKTGHARVVCGVSGKPLRPYYMPRNGHLANGQHAFFSVPEQVITVSANKENIKITRHVLSEVGDRVGMESEEIWSGRQEELPETFGKYAAAVEAAAKKASCYHCRHAHYVAVKEES